MYLHYYLYYSAYQHYKKHLTHLISRDFQPQILSGYDTKQAHK